MHTEVLYLPDMQSREISTFGPKSIKSSKCTLMFCTCPSPKTEKLTLLPQITSFQVNAHPHLYLPNTKTVSCSKKRAKLTTLPQKMDYLWWYYFSHLDCWLEHECEDCEDHAHCVPKSDSYIVNLFINLLRNNA